MNLKMVFLLAVIVTGIHSDILINLNGTVTSKSGTPLENAIVTIEKLNVDTVSNAGGAYVLSRTVDVKRKLSLKGNDLTIRNGSLLFNNTSIANIKVEQFNLNGQREFIIEKKLVQGQNTINLLESAKGNVSVLRISLDKNVYTMKANRVAGTLQLKDVALVSKQKSAAITAEADTLRVSKAGYKSARIPLVSYSGTMNAVLEPLDTAKGSTSGIDDGSVDRIQKWGVPQYFWGPIGGVDQPIVRITHAVSADVIDIEVVFSPWFVDNTYGTGAVGWSKSRGHTFRDLYVSDHVALSILNGAGQTVFNGKLDLLSVLSTAKTGYACLGPFGGDGVLTTGNATDIVSFGSSLDDNLNYYGYNLQENSPETDSTYKQNPAYPYWQFYVLYRLTIKASAFGASGYGKAAMTSVHASPAKDPQETITVIERNPPVKDSPLDVFRFLVIKPVTPPVIDTIDVD
ncbi:MAG TPA: carboxypeptidase-like regulatory domain-containing protein [Chitinispirillaceae bacterium]|nr:carboxypeptidase-like regulatory domain-containing protein [Chitinispirillaceae bacterium]